mmetsp:Transcript_58722/g.128985  ORF Transcript_58722/g.128985 Transcript_58722/m.128985 type:complete len:217 (-) Transcript_58722:329-979(-)
MLQHQQLLVVLLLEFHLLDLDLLIYLQVVLPLLLVAHCEEVLGLLLELLGQDVRAMSQLVIQALRICSLLLLDRLRIRNSCRQALRGRWLSRGQRPLRRPNVPRLISRCRLGPIHHLRWWRCRTTGHGRGAHPRCRCRRRRRNAGARGRHHRNRHGCVRSRWCGIARCGRGVADRRGSRDAGARGGSIHWDHHGLIHHPWLRLSVVLLSVGHGHSM